MIRAPPKAAISPFHQGPDGAEFAEVAFKMYPGQLSNPVKTQFGWHIIKLEDKRTKHAGIRQGEGPDRELPARKAQTEFIIKLRHRQDRAPDKPADKAGRKASGLAAVRSEEELTRSTRCIGLLGPKSEVSLVPALRVFYAVTEHVDARPIRPSVRDKSVMTSAVSARARAFS